MPAHIKRKGWTVRGWPMKTARFVRKKENQRKGGERRKNEEPRVQPDRPGGLHKETGKGEKRSGMVEGIGGNADIKS